MECSHYSLSFSGPALLSTEFTPSVRLMIHTDIGTITIGTRALNPDILGELENTITSLILDMGFTLPDTTSKGDDE